MRLCLVEDLAVAGLEPLTLTRPAHHLLLGASPLGDRILNAFRPTECAQVIRAHLAALQKQRNPQAIVNDPHWLAKGPVLAARSRWVPPAGFVAPESSQPWLGLCEGEVACAFVGPDHAARLTPHHADAWFEDLPIVSHLRVFELGGQWINRPWDLVTHNAAYLERDFHQLPPGPLATPAQLASLALVGPPERLRIDPSARIDPCTVFDTTSGPITLEAGVWVQPFTRVEGPCHIGPGSQLFRANLRGAVTIGPNCRIGGEVECSLIHGHSNKYHEGFLGHAYVGEWVNLGAITSNSDLRNDYGEVHVPLQGDPIPTGMAKVGCFIGDHTRTGMGSMLNTGTAIGVMCNVLPAGWLLPKHIPSFTAVRYGRVAPGFSLDQMFDTARIVMSRRGQHFTDTDEQLYRQLHDQTRLERERAFHKSRHHRNDPWPLASTASS